MPVTDEEADNTYLSSMEGSKWGADSRAADIRSALDTASLAMMAGAWESTRANQFGRELSDHRGALMRLGNVESDELDEKIATEPEKVSKNSWRATFTQDAGRQLR